MLSMIMHPKYGDIKVKVCFLDFQWISDGSLWHALLVFSIWHPKFHKSINPFTLMFLKACLVLKCLWQMSHTTPGVVTCFDSMWLARLLFWLLVCPHWLHSNWFWAFLKSMVSIVRSSSWKSVPDNPTVTFIVQQIYVSACLCTCLLRDSRVG